MLLLQAAQLLPQLPRLGLPGLQSSLCSAQSCCPGICYAAQPLLQHRLWVERVCLWQAVTHVPAGQHSYLAEQAGRQVAALNLQRNAQQRCPSCKPNTRASLSGQVRQADRQLLRASKHGVQWPLETMALTTASAFPVTAC